MRLLLDSHALIWLYTGNERLSQAAKTLIENQHSQCFMSMASIWEMAIKIKLGKMHLEVPLHQFVTDVTENNIQILPVEVHHILQIQVLDLHHRDPFDRLLFAQAITESMTLISADEIADPYLAGSTITRVW